MVGETGKPGSKTAGPRAASEARVGVFGGSFNPPHVAHVLAVVYALATAPIDEVLVVPVFKHPFAKELAPFEDRMEMCELAMGWIPNVRISAVERELGGESLTLHTLQRLSAENPAWKMRLIIGSDVVPDLSKWHRFDQVAELAEPFVLQRAGASAGEVLLPDVSSTRVRSLLSSLSSRGESSTAEAGAEDPAELLARLIPASVLTYAINHGLYLAPSAEAKSAG